MTRKGFSLPMVLILMAVMVIISAIIMDMTTSYFHSAQATVEHQNLYNAAQSGIEAAKAWLYYNRNNLEVLSGDSVPVSSADLFAKVSGSPFVYPGTHDHVDVTTVYVMSCNYTPPTGGYIRGLPPVYRAYFPGTVSGNMPGEGQSGYIDPNRDLSGGSGVSGRVFLIRSFASSESRRIGIESMVVIPNKN